MSDTFDNYFKQLTLCMSAYQYIEFGLRFCLVRCQATIEFRLRGYMPYKSSNESIEKAAMERLIEMYKAFTENEMLIKELRAINKERNLVAHRGYELSLEEQRDDDELRSKTEEFARYHERAMQCFTSLQIEMKEKDKIVERAYAELRAQESKS